MTCIAGIAEGGAVFIGGDSAGVAGYDLSVRADAKVFTRGDLIFGFTSSFRMGQLLRYALPDLSPKPDDDLEKWLSTVFVDAVRKTLKDGGFANKKEEVESGGTFLLGVGGRLFMVGSDYQVGENVDGFDAVGCGQAYALGAFHASRDLRWPPRNKVVRALRAAARFSAGVRDPFVIKRGGRRRG